MLWALCRFDRELAPSATSTRRRQPPSRRGQGTAFRSPIDANPLRSRLSTTHSELDSAARLSPAVTEPGLVMLVNDWGGSEWQGVEWQTRPVCERGQDAAR